MQHIWETHQNCQVLYCPICEGGLASCTVCTAAEGQLPKECPGVQMTEEQKERVYAGDLDYRDGQWIKLDNG